MITVGDRSAFGFYFPHRLLQLGKEIILYTPNHCFDWLIAREIHLRYYLPYLFLFDRVAISISDLIKKI